MMRLLTHPTAVAQRVPLFFYCWDFSCCLGANQHQQPEGIFGTCLFVWNNRTRKFLPFYGVLLYKNSKGRGWSLFAQFGWSVTAGNLIEVQDDKRNIQELSIKSTTQKMCQPENYVFLVSRIFACNNQRLASSWSVMDPPIHSKVPN